VFCLANAQKCVVPKFGKRSCPRFFMRRRGFKPAAASGVISHPLKQYADWLIYANNTQFILTCVRSKLWKRKLWPAVRRPTIIVRKYERYNDFAGIFHLHAPVISSHQSDIDASVFTHASQLPKALFCFRIALE
jgi:hypothetical protein